MSAMLFVKNRFIVFTLPYVNFWPASVARRRPAHAGYLACSPVIARSLPGFMPSSQSP